MNKIVTSIRIELLYHLYEKKYIPYRISKSKIIINIKFSNIIKNKNGQQALKEENHR